MAAGLPGRAQYPRCGSIPQAMNYKTTKERITLTGNMGLITTASGRTLEEMKAGIRIRMRNMVNNALEIGIDLMEVKEACRHGEWMPFLREIGISASSAANYMRIAKEVSADSAMARLPYTKILALLSAPAEEREELAAAAEDMSAAEIRRLTEERNRAAEAANTETMRADQAEEALRKSEADAKDIYDRNASLRTEMQNLQVKLEKAREGQKQAEAGCNILKGSVEKQKEIINDLQEKLIVAENQQKIEVVPADYEQLKRDREEILAAAEEAEKRVADAEAELEALKAGGAGQPEPVWKVLKVAMTRFMTDCEMMPLDPAAMAADRTRIEANLTRLEKWADMMRIALAGVVPGEGAVE